MQRALLPGQDLTDVPELTNAALEYARMNPGAGCLIDRVHPGCPLIISFGFAEWYDLPRFDFFGRTKKFEQRTGLTLNRLLLRDPLNAWYQRGVPGMGTHVDEVVGTLRSLIRSIRPSRVVTIGQSMGGYAAIMFGMLLDADRIVAFGALSHLDPLESICYGDLRFLRVLERLELDPPKSGYLDLASLGTALDYRGTLHLVFGTHPVIDDGFSVNPDAIHAFRLAGLANVVLHPYPDAAHTVVEWLVEHEQMNDLLGRLLVDGEDLVGPGAPSIPAEAS